MNELDVLTQKKDALLERIRQIEASCEGIDNEVNAAKVTELNGRQAELLAQKSDLKGKLADIDGELDAIGHNIRELSASGVSRILEAIKNQRFYFFKNKEKIFFDRMTGLVWPNLNYYNIGDGDALGQCRGNFIWNTDPNTRLRTLELSSIADWEVPSVRDLQQLLCSSSFPFRCENSSDWIYIKKNDNDTECAFRVSDRGSNTAANVHKNMRDVSTGHWNYILLPMSSCLCDADYPNRVAPENTVFTENEKLEITLGVFTRNGLIPLFDDEKITQLYRQIYIDKPLLLKELSEVEAQICKLPDEPVGLTSGIDAKTLLAGYDVKAIDASVIQYTGAVRSLTDTILGMLQEYETAQNETVGAFSRIAVQLSAKYTESPHLTTEENELLEQRQQVLSERLDLGMDDVKQQILSLKKQAAAIAGRIDTINHGENAIHDLALLEREPRVSFTLLAENLVHMVRGVQQKVDFFVRYRTFVTNLIQLWTAWSDDFKTFKTSRPEELADECRSDGIDETVYQSWYADWQEKRLTIERLFLPITEFSLQGHLLSDEDTPTPMEQTLTLLQTYKNDVDKFYLHERKHIYQKFAFQSGGDLQEKFETESELYKLTEQFQRRLQKLIFSREDAEERIFLLRWSEPLLHVPIDAITEFVRDRGLTAISETVMTQFAALKRQNFVSYLADSRAYGEALQKREKEYNALVFRMRKELMKQ